MAAAVGLYHRGMHVFPDALAPRGLPPGALLILSLAAFGGAFATRVMDPILPLLASEFSVSLADAAQVVTVFSLAYGLALLLFGPLGDRFGKFRVIGWSVMACALTSLACALAPDFSGLVAARLVSGVAAAAIIPLAMAFIGDTVPYAERQPVLARFLLGQILGMSAGVVVGGLAADTLGWRMPFWGLACWFVAIAYALRRVGCHIPRPATSPAVARPPLLQMAGEFGRVMAVPWARVVLLTVFLEGMCIFGTFAFMAAHLHTTFGLPLATAGAALMGFGAGGVAFSLGAQRLVAGLGEVRLACCGAGAVAVALVAMACAPAWWWAVPGCFAMGMGFYMQHNTLQTHATQMAPQRRGAAVAAFASCFFLGQAAGVWLAGQAVARHGTRPMLVAGALGILALGMAFGCLQLRRARGLQAARV
jgi:predicted MFS family arabinose efflux permease